MNPHDIPQVTYDEFSKNIHGKLTDERVPTDGVLELTYRCNLRCRHCYCVPDPAKAEATYVQTCRILDEIAEAGCLWLLLTGGEPLVRPDFREIYTYAVKKGLLVTFFTNGTLITPDIADLLKEYKPFSTEITLYGATAGTYEKVTGVTGSFERCMNGIRLFRERGVPLKLKTMVMTLNRHELDGMKLLAASLGLKFKFDPLINARLDGSKEPCALRISPEEIVELDLADETRRAEWSGFCKKFWNHVYDDRLFSCGAGVNYFHINPYGELRLCEMVAEPAFDLKYNSFKEGWNEFIPKIRRRKRTRDTKCKVCEANPICDQCPGWAILENNDPETPVDFLCEIARLRTEAFGMTKKKTEVAYVGKEALSKT